MGSVTSLVAEDTSSDTITFEDEAFPLGRAQASESFSGGEGGRKGPCLEMTHRTGSWIPRGRVPLTQMVYAQWALLLWKFLFVEEGRKHVYLP